MIDYKEYEGTLTDLGTVASQIGTKGTIKFVAKNFANPAKRVVVVLKNEAGQSAVVSCSNALSAVLRKSKEDGAKQDEVLASLLDMSVMEGTEEVPFITMPAGEQTEGFTAAQLKKVKKPAKIEALNEIAW